MFSSSSPSWGSHLGHSTPAWKIKPQQSFSGTFCRIGPCKPGGHGSVVGTGLLQENQMPPISRLLCLSSNSCPNIVPTSDGSSSSSVFHRYPWIEVSPQLVSSSFIPSSSLLAHPRPNDTLPGTSPNEDLRASWHKDSRLQSASPRFSANLRNPSSSPKCHPKVPPLNPRNPRNPSGPENGEHRSEDVDADPLIRSSSYPVLLCWYGRWLQFFPIWLGVSKPLAPTSVVSLVHLNQYSLLKPKWVCVNMFCPQNLTVSHHFPRKNMPQNGIPAIFLDGIKHFQTTGPPPTPWSQHLEGARPWAHVLCQGSATGMSFPGCCNTFMTSALLIFFHDLLRTCQNQVSDSQSKEWNKSSLAQGLVCIYIYTHMCLHVCMYICTYGGVP